MAACRIELSKPRDGIGILGIELKRFLIIENGSRLVARLHVRFPEAVINVGGLWIGVDVELQDADCFVESLCPDEPVSDGIELAFAASIAVRSLALPFGSPPPCFAEIVISRISFVNSAPRFASVAAL